jgi:hypothetical protein
MPHDARPPMISDRTGRLNAALLAQGRQAVTTDATGGADIAMLRGSLEALGMALAVSAPDGAGYLTATISRRVSGPGGDPLVAAVRGVGRSAVMVEAAIAALTAPGAGAG